MSGYCLLGTDELRCSVARRELLWMATLPKLTEWLQYRDEAGCGFGKVIGEDGLGSM